MRRFTRFMAAILMILGLAGGDLRGATIEIGITAEISEIDDPYGLLSGQLGVGDEITGSYMYDSDTLDSSAEPDYGGYLYTSHPYGIFLMGGDLSFNLTCIMLISE